MVTLESIKPFKLVFKEQQKHLSLPQITSIVLTQNLYEMLFQYVMSPEKEKKLKTFIERLEKHIKSKARTPFSAPIAELEFLDNGLEELQLLNWMEIPVSLFTIEFMDPGDDNDDNLENVLSYLENLITFNRREDTQDIYVYPSNLTTY